LFVLPSSHEGLPITLLEAMSYELKVLASNIPANLAVALPSDCYFDLNQEKALEVEIDKQLNNQIIQKKYNLSKYNWDTIANQTLDVYRSICQD
jgi:glycosyltransferase involved in cell wall biosynthesis